MTDYEATVMLNEHRTVYPVFIIGRGRYVVRPDGQVNCWDAVGNQCPTRNVTRSRSRPPPPARYLFADPAGPL